MSNSGRQFLVGAALLAVTFASASAPFAARCDNVESCLPQLRFGETRALRELAAQTLGERGDPVAITTLVTALQEDDGEYVRAAAAWALGQIGPHPDSALALSRRLLEDGRREVRIGAAVAIARLQAPEGIAAMTRALGEDVSAEVRNAAAVALVSLQGEGAEAALLEALRAEGDRGVRRTVAESLGMRKQESAAGGLIRALQMDSAIEVRQEAARALGRIGGEAAREALAYYAEHSVFRQIQRAARDALALIPLEAEPQPTASTTN